MAGVAECEREREGGKAPERDSKSTFARPSPLSTPLSTRDLIDHFLLCVFFFYLLPATSDTRCVSIDCFYCRLLMCVLRGKLTMTRSAEIRPPLTRLNLQTFHFGPPFHDRQGDCLAEPRKKKMDSAYLLPRCLPFLSFRCARSGRDPRKNGSGPTSRK